VRSNLYLFLQCTIILILKIITGEHIKIPDKSISNEVRNGKNHHHIRRTAKKIEEQRIFWKNRREKNGVLVRGIPIEQNDQSSGIMVFHCNFYNDGNGDIGNVIDVALQVMNHYPYGYIKPYFVLTAHNITQENKTPEQLIEDTANFFEKEATHAFKNYPVDIKDQVFYFISNPNNMDKISNPSNMDKTYHEEAFDLLISENKLLQKIYASADAVFNIATPFPELPETVKLKTNAQIIIITEHNASSQSTLFSSIPEEHCYVTGITNNRSGLMVENLACNLDLSVKALQEIEDKIYIEKIGLTYPVSNDEARKFLSNTLVVPVYIGEDQKNILASCLYLVSRSPLGKSFDKIIFHINKRAWDESVFEKNFHALIQNEESSLSFSLPKIELIIGHYFEEKKDLQRLYQLSSGRGVAICSSDKVFELAISCDLLPLYPPVRWKQSIYNDLCDLLKESGNLYELYLSYESKKPYDQHIASLLTTDALQYWRNHIRPDLLQNSFYNVLHTKILNPYKKIQDHVSAGNLSLFAEEVKKSEETSKDKNNPDSHSVITIEKNKHI